MGECPDLFDTHCHLGHDADDPIALVEEARNAGVEWLLDVGIDASTSAAARTRARRLPRVFFSAGLHPTDADRLEEEWPALVALAADPACVAIGETGFDLYWDRAQPDQQRESFDRHIELAKTLGKPVIVHCRDAFALTFESLRRHAGTRFVMHCFSGGIDEARQALDLGGVLSFAGPLTYPRSHAVREAAAFAPADRILVETDAPFLPPQSHRGERNRPAWIRETAERMAAIRGERYVTLAMQTTANARELLGV